MLKIVSTQSLVLNQTEFHRGKNFLRVAELIITQVKLLKTLSAGGTDQDFNNAFIFKMVATQIKFLE